MATKKKVKEIAKVATGAQKVLERPETITAGVNVNNYLPSTDTNLVGKNQYIGMRYVPKFYDEPWNSLISYEPLSIVEWTDGDGNKGQYVSKWFTTIGKDPSNEDEWLEIFNFTPAFNDLVKKVNENYSTLDGKIDSEKEELNAKITNNQNAITEEAQNRAEADRQTNANVTSNKNEIDSLDTRVESIEDTIQAIPSKEVLNSLESDVSEAKTDISNIKNDITTISTDISSIKNDLEFEEFASVSDFSTYKNNSSTITTGVIIRNKLGNIIKTSLLFQFTGNTADERLNGFKIIVLNGKNPYGLDVVTDNDLKSNEDMSKLFRLGCTNIKTPSNNTIPCTIRVQYDGTNTIYWAMNFGNSLVQENYASYIETVTLDSNIIVQ